VKDVRFYEEFTDSSKTVSEGNVVAVLDPTQYRVERFGHGTETLYDAAGAVFKYANSPVAGTSVAASYLRERCKKIGEARAREIHPALFEWLEAGK
jgi:hypothetical protein